jgi:sugar lactone lactonase YvrE
MLRIVAIVFFAAFGAMPASSQTILGPVSVAQIINFSAPPDTPLTGGPVTLTATGGASGNPVTFTSNSFAVCTASGSRVTLVAAGACSITANQAGNAIFAAAVPVTRSFAVTPGSQTITFTTPPIQPSSGGSVVLTATASSGLTVRYKSNSPTVCQVSGRHAIPLSTGLCSITASHVGDDNYAAALPVTTTFAVTGTPVATQASLLPKASALPSNRPVTDTSGGGGGAVITTIAGNGSRGYGGDNGPATSATLFFPTGTALDSSGNVYIVDYINSRIRKVTASTGVITTIAGNGTAGYSGDSGPATSAELNYPTGIALDNAGNIYFADTLNVRIRRITAATGIITTVAGNGTLGPWGDNGPATSASMAYPDGVAVDSSGNIYIADTDNGTIRKVTASTGVITTIAGTGYVGSSGDGGPATNATMNYPNEVALDGSGNIYIADSDNNKIRKITASTGIITTVAGSGTSGYSGDGGAATSATLNTPFGVSVDNNSNIYVADFYNNTIREVAAATGVITTIAGTGTAGYSGDNGPATSAQLKYPWGASIASSGGVYIADYYNNRIRAIAPTLATQTITFGPLSNVALGSGPVTLTATASSGLVVSFASTTPSVCAIVSGNSVVLLATGSCSITASQSGNSNYLPAANVVRGFTVTPQQPQSITFTSNPSGLIVTIDGTNYAAPVTLSWLPGGTHVVGVPSSPQPAGSGVQYVLGSWSGGISSIAGFPAPSSPTTYTANFVTEYYLTANATGGGSITPSSGWYDAGSSVPVSASASSGYHFSGFTGGLNGVTNPQTLTMNAPSTVTANFTSAPVVTTGLLPRATVGYGYNQQLAVGGGSPQYSWSLTQSSVALPPWLTLTQGGALQGTPPDSSAGTTITFEVQVSDINGLVSSPQDLSLSVYFSTLSINGGPSSAVTLPGVVVPFTYSIYDIDYGADDVQWAQYYLSDGSGNVHCLGNWGRPNGLDLYDGNTGVTYGFGINQSDAFCTVSLVSITDSPTDPTEVTVVLNFTFNASVSGTFSVLNQVNYFSFGAPVENVGTLQINPSGGVLLSDVTQGTTAQAGSALAAWVGDSFTLAVSGPSGQSVTVAQNGGSDVAVGSTDGRGNWSSSGTWQISDIGNYSQVWKVGGTPINPNPILFQVSQFPSSYTTSGSPPPVIAPTGPPDTSAPQAFSGTAQACFDATGTWLDALGESWLLQQTGNTINGSISLLSLTWTVSGTITNGVANITGSSPSGSLPNGQPPATTVNLVFSPGCSTANGQETETFPPNVQSSINSTQQFTHLTRTTAIPSINFTFDISGAQNQITATLIGAAYNGAPPNLTKTGNLTVKLSAGGSSFASPNVPAAPDFQVVNQANATAGPNQMFSFNRRNLPVGHYTQVIAQWDDITVTIPRDIVVLGSTRFSQYNTPNESAPAPYACPVGTAVPIYILSSTTSCTWTPVNVNPTFRLQANINGTGITAGNQTIQDYAVTTKSCPLPAGGVLDLGKKNGFAGNTYQAVSSTIGACNKTLYSGSSLATYLGPHDQNSQFSCSSKVLLLDNSGNTEDTKAVQDKCANKGGCGDDLPHIDTYTSATACRAKAINDLPLSPAFAISVK